MHDSIARMKKSLAGDFLNITTLSSRIEELRKMLGNETHFSKYFPQRPTLKYLKICFRIFFIIPRMLESMLHMNVA